MAEAGLKKVLEQIEHLAPDELHEVERAIRQRLQPAQTEAAREAALRVLEQSGLVREVKRPPMVAGRQRPPVPIEGAPLSETIIRERR